MPLVCSILHQRKSRCRFAVCNRYIQAWASALPSDIRRAMREASKGRTVTDTDSCAFFVPILTPTRGRLRLCLEMKNVFILIVSFLLALAAHADTIKPGQTKTLTVNATAGDHSPLWDVDNPTLQLSSNSFNCNVYCAAKFGGTATVTCTYKMKVGITSEQTITKKWTYTCIDSGGDSIGGNYTDNMYDENYNLSTTNPTFVSYEEWDSSGTTVVTLDEAGTLSNFILDGKKYTIKNLTIIGPLNGADLRLLRDMAGADYDKKTTGGKLEVLDLKEAIFVSGGPWYIQNDNYGSFYYTADNAILPK